MKKTIKIILALAIITICSTATNVYASSFNFDMATSSTTLKPGETLTIDLKVAKIDVGENGINTVEAILEYDEKVFEKVTSSDFAGQNNWSITYNGEEGANKGKLVAVIVQEGVKQDQAIAKLTLKVKKDIKDQTTKVTLKNIKTNDGVNEIATADKVTAINIKTPVVETPKEDKPIVEIPKEDKPVVETPKEDKPSIQTPKPEPKLPKKLPQTGENSYLIIVVTAIIAISGIGAYIAYKRNNY